MLFAAGVGASALQAVNTSQKVSAFDGKLTFTTKGKTHLASTASCDRRFACLTAEKAQVFAMSVS